MKHKRERMTEEEGKPPPPRPPEEGDPERGNLRKRETPEEGNSGRGWSAG